MKRWIHREPIEASTSPIGAESDLQWMNGLWWDIDGHDHTITQVKGYPQLKCQVTEKWIAEDTGREVRQTSMYKIKEDNDGHLYIESIKNPSFKLYLNSAFNYKELVPDKFDGLDFLDDDDDYEDDYTPSSTRGDYGPSNPWDAPGMSIRDFI